MDKTGFSVTTEWNPSQQRLARLLAKDETFAEGLALCAAMHRNLHDLGAAGTDTIYRRLLAGLPRDAMLIRPAGRFASIAWNLWHITRIEDAVANLLIGDGVQVLDAAWLAALNSPVTDTGNAFGEADVDAFDSRINAAELLRYRQAVGKKTQRLLAALTAADRRRKPAPDRLERLAVEGVLTAAPESSWLAGFWARKTVTGLLTMPITRHQVVHLSDCFKLKAKAPSTA